MFINKLALGASTSTNKMSNYIYAFLHAELTCIPGELNKIIENYYSNAHCNGATWLFFLWNVLHLVYDKCLHAFLRRVKFKQHVCSRIKDSLWYMGFSGTALIYCGATLAINEMELFNFKRMHVPSDRNLSNQVILGYTLICTFYLHTAFWEGIKNGSLTSFVKYLFLALLCIFSYILRILEVMFSLTGLISITQVATELTRLIYSLSRKNSYLSTLLTFGLFALTLGLYVLLQLIIIPLTFALPLGLRILSDYPNVLLICLYLSLLVWLVLDIYKSVVLSFFDHWLYHSKAERENSPCANKILECALFQPRNDDAYHLQILRNEMKERQQELISRRKPKSRSVIVQTLKCMVAIKRKLNQKRLSESSDSEDSDKSEDVQKNEDVSDVSIDCSKHDDRSSDECADKETDDSSDNKMDKNGEEPPTARLVDAETDDYSNNEDSCDDVSDSSSKHGTDASEKLVRENGLPSDGAENEGTLEEKRNSSENGIAKSDGSKE